MSSNCCQQMSTQSLRGVGGKRAYANAYATYAIAWEPTPGAKDVLWSSHFIYFSASRKKRYSIGYVKTDSNFGNGSSITKGCTMYK